jgi:hypothetical protein
MRKFYNYRCESPFAEFYQLAACAAPVEVLRESFSRLPDGVRSALCLKVYDESGNTDSLDPQSGEYHAFDDLHIFNKALKRVVWERFNRLPPEQKKVVYREVHPLAQGENEDFSDPKWGEIRAFDNILRLIDAMETVSWDESHAFENTEPVPSSSRMKRKSVCLEEPE